ncbi:lytic polysaccharide monooxygenase [Enterobacter mori]
MTLNKFRPLRDPQAISRKVSSRHGAIASPSSRASLAEAAGMIEGNLQYGIESGKFFPETRGGLKDKDAPDDIVSMAPPADGKIASGERPAAAYLDRTDIDWVKHKVYGGEALDFVWEFSALHKYRRFNYFITRPDWDPLQPLSRAQFESDPFATFLNTRQPFWAYSSEEMWPAQPTTHSLVLPKREGYHVLLGVWEIAETDKAFYQVVDLEFLPGGEESQRPETPTGFALDNEPAFDSVRLKWNPSSGPYPVNRYIIQRNGSTLTSVNAALTRYTDITVNPLTYYSYTISAVDERGNESLTSAPVSVTTPGEDGNNSPPAAPRNLHDMGVSASTVDLMWSAPDSALLSGYIIYRDGHEVQRIAASQLTWRDSKLAANTAYRYFVTAMGTNGQESVPGNVHTIRTPDADGGEFPVWELNATYKTGDVVRYNERLWQCLAGHTAYEPAWAPGAEDGFTLWKEYTG